MSTSLAAHLTYPNNSSLNFKQFMAERDEILRHKWLESEKAGRDIGFEAALLSWVAQHRKKWLTELSPQA